MRVRTITQAAAVTATAAALVFSGGAIATADDASPQAQGSAPATAGKASTAGFSGARVTAKAANITSARAQSIAIGSRKNRSIAVQLGGTVASGTTRIVTNITRGGKLKARVSVSPSTGRGYFTWTVGHGRGAYKVGPTRVYRGSSSYVDMTTGKFSVKSNTKTTLRMSKRSNSTLRVSKSYVKAYSPSKNRYVAYNPIAKLKVKSGSSYRTKKTLKLRRGYDRYTFRTANRHTYRLYTRSSSLVWGTRTGYIKI